MNAVAPRTPPTAGAWPARPARSNRSCLFVRPAASRDANGGDTIVYRRWAEYVSARVSIEVLELPPIGRAGQLWNVARGAPPEAARYDGAQNRRALRAALAKRRFDLVLFAHEGAFPLGDEPALAGIRKVYFTQNLHSLIAKTDHSWAARILQPGAARFERRWYGDLSARLLCISQADLAGLRALGIERPEVSVAPPGAPPQTPLSPSATLRPEAVVTGSYGWWRKRRDLRRLAAERPSLPVPILVRDTAAAEILRRHEKVIATRAIDWGLGVRFGIVSDRFLGGFKLKAVEYVAGNCVVLSLCDLRDEFAGLPHAEEFVRFVRSKKEMADLIQDWLGSPDEQRIERFRIFKAACLERYDWERCLAPLGEALLI